jgi:hypothetical protein
MIRYTLRSEVPVSEDPEFEGGDCIGSSSNWLVVYLICSRREISVRG